MQEIVALVKNSTWKIIGIPEEAHLVDCKCVYTIKYKSDETIECYKAYLVAKRFSQKYNINYLDTFALIAKMNTIKVILAIAVVKYWQFYQFDIKNDFLNRKLKEKVYICMPHSYEKTKKCWNKCFIWSKTPKAWFHRLRIVISMNYKQGITRYQWSYIIH